MPKFLTTRNTAAHIEEIIIEAKEILVLVSPFVFIPPNLVVRLKDAVSRNVKTLLVLKEQEDKEISEYEIRKFCDIGLQVLGNERIHGKAYFNENEAIVTSFNLIEASERNSIEFGILIKKEENKDIYERIVSECTYLINQSNPFEMSDDGSYFIQDRLGTEKLNKQKNGFCIRCHSNLPFDPTHPYCLTCYKAWDKRTDNVEKYCHFCGNSNGVISFNGSICYQCI